MPSTDGVWFPWMAGSSEAWEYRYEASAVISAKFLNEARRNHPYRRRAGIVGKPSMPWHHHIEILLLAL